MSTTIRNKNLSSQQRRDLEFLGLGLCGFNFRPGHRKITNVYACFITVNFRCALGAPTLFGLGIRSGPVSQGHNRAYCFSVIASFLCPNTTETVSSGFSSMVSRSVRQRKISGTKDSGCVSEYCMPPCSNSQPIAISLDGYEQPTSFALPTKSTPHSWCSAYRPDTRLVYLSIARFWTARLLRYSPSDCQRLVAKKRALRQNTKPQITYGASQRRARNEGNNRISVQVMHDVPACM